MDGIAEAIWLGILIVLGVCAAVAHHRHAAAVNPAGHRTRRPAAVTDSLGAAAVNPADSLRGQPRPQRRAPEN